MKNCTVCHSTENYYAKGLCRKHYAQRQRKPKAEIPVVPTKQDVPLTRTRNYVTITFLDNQQRIIDAGTIPRVVENGMLMVIGADGFVHHFPISNNIREFNWKLKNDI